MRQPIVLRSLAAGVLTATVMLGSASASSGPKQQTIVIPQGWPKVLSIPKIGIKYAPIESNAFNQPKDVEAPFSFKAVAWYDRGPRPGDIGRASIYGHLDSYTGPAIFYRLKDLKKGDSVTVAYPGSRSLTFVVQWSRMYPNNALPDKFLYGTTTDRGIALITCGGYFHRNGSGYDHKLIVYAKLAVPTAGHR